MTNKDKDPAAQGTDNPKPSASRQQSYQLPKPNQQNVNTADKQLQQQLQQSLAYSTQFDNRSNASSQSNTLKSNVNVKRPKKKPQLQKNPSFNFQVASPKYVYSVDDDVDEIEQDIEREYLEGYNDALRHRYRKSTKNLKESSKNQDISNLTHDVLNNLINAEANIRKLEQKEGDSHDQSEVNSQLTHESSHRPGLVENQYHSSHRPSHHQFHQLQSHQSHASSQIHEPQQPEQGDDNIAGNNVPEIGDEDNDDDSRSMTSSEEDFTLRSRQDAINTTHPFGIRIWKPALYKKSRSVEREADKDIHEDLSQKKTISWGVHFSNFLWSITFGVILFVLCTLGSIILLVTGQSSVEYARVFFNLGIYFLWPFGKVIYLKKDENYLSEDLNEGTTFGEYERWRNEEHSKLFFSSSYSNLPGSAMPSAGPNASSSDQQPSQQPQIRPPYQQQLSQLSQRNVAPMPSIDETVDDDNDNKKLRLFGRGDWTFARILFYLYFYLILQPIFLVIWSLCWLFVFTIPMAKIISNLTDHLRRHPLAVFFKFDSKIPLPSDKLKSSNILLCTFRASGFHYYRYTVEGTNIFFINLMFVVFFTIVDFFIIKDFFGIETLLTNESIIFSLCLLSIVPLAYFIGQAVASISAQSSMGVGAVINAFFSTIVEIFLYCVALNQQKGALVEGSMIGSILGGVLLLPGLSMCAGAFIRKTQRYNPASAGVSSTMLLFSISVMFAPTIFHQIYGSYEINCTPCIPTASHSFQQTTCQKCHFFQPPLKFDSLFRNILKPFSIICALLLFLAYSIGLWFTLRTHAALIWQTPVTDKPVAPQQQPPNGIPQQVKSLSASTDNIAEIQQSQEAESGGHDAPNWSRQKSTIVLLGATLLYAIIAEILVDCVDSVLKKFPINPKFLGITIFALVPNTTEFLNAISFATHGNVALSMEIGSAYALQVCLIQIPSLVLYSIFFIADQESLVDIKDSMFTLIFPKWDLVASIISVVLFTYIYAEGKSNYFKGSILILIYIIVIIGFYFTGKVESSDLFLTQFIIG